MDPRLATSNKSCLFWGDRGDIITIIYKNDGAANNVVNMELIDWHLRPPAARGVGLAHHGCGQQLSGIDNLCIKWLCRGRQMICGGAGQCRRVAGS